MRKAKDFPKFDGEKGLPLITKTGNSVARNTGTWRVFAPKLDRSKCVRCRLCFVFCPDSAISLDAEGYPVVDYSHCKGCLICVNECKVKALSAVKEGEKNE